jgi:hypothetical protein
MRTQKPQFRPATPFRAWVFLDAFRPPRYCYPERGETTLQHEA